VKALLDEQLSPQIAVLLRETGYDVVGVAEQRPRAQSGTCCTNIPTG
jgi:hypothetical protein